MSAREPLRCTDGCGKTVADMTEAMAKAWHILEITGRLRCTECARALDAVNFPMLCTGNREIE